MHFQTALTSEHVADFGCVPFSELGSTGGALGGGVIMRTCTKYMTMPF